MSDPTFQHGEPVHHLRRGYGWGKYDDATFVSYLPRDKAAIEVMRRGKPQIKTVDVNNVLPVTVVSESLA